MTVHSSVTPRGPSRKRATIAVLLIIAAIGLGLARAESQQAKTPVFYSTTCEPLAEAAVTENLIIHSTAQPITSTLTETITLPATNQYAQILTSVSDQRRISEASACLFTELAGKAPSLISIANGMATFNDTDQVTLPVGLEWQGSLHPHDIRLAFSPDPVCANFPYANWGGSTLEVTVATGTANSVVTPQPFLFQHQSYSWRSPPASCGRIPHLSVSIPIGLAEYVSTEISEPRGDWLSLAEVLGWSEPLIIALVAFSLAFRTRRVNSVFRIVFLLIALAGLSFLPAVIDFSFHGYRQDPAELTAFYGLALCLALASGRSPPIEPRREER